MQIKRDDDRSWMSAVTFAEAGEWETALSMTPLPAAKGRWAEFLEKTFMAVAFAEEGMPDEALRLVGAKAHPQRRIATFLDSIGLRDVKMAYGTFHEEAVC